MIVDFVFLVVGFAAGVLVGRANKKEADKLADAAAKVKSDLDRIVGQ